MNNQNDKQFSIKMPDQNKHQSYCGPIALDKPSGHLQLEHNKPRYTYEMMINIMRDEIYRSINCGLYRPALMETFQLIDIVAKRAVTTEDARQYARNNNLKVPSVTSDDSAYDSLKYRCWCDKNLQGFFKDSEVYDDNHNVVNSLTAEDIWKLRCQVLHANESSLDIWNSNRDMLADSNKLQSKNRSTQNSLGKQIKFVVIKDYLGQVMQCDKDGHLRFFAQLVQYKKGTELKDNATAIIHINLVRFVTCVAEAALREVDDHENKFSSIAENMLDIYETTERVRPAEILRDKT